MIRFRPADRASRASIPIQNENAEFPVGHELSNSDCLAPQYALSVARWVRPTPKPHYFRWRARVHREVVKVEVSANKNEVICLGKVPDRMIRTLK
jgi:hypothetical protein